MSRGLTSITTSQHLHFLFFSGWPAPERNQRKIEQQIAKRGSKAFPLVSVEAFVCSQLWEIWIARRTWRFLSHLLRSVCRARHVFYLLLVTIPRHLVSQAAGAIFLLCSHSCCCLHKALPSRSKIIIEVLPPWQCRPCLRKRPLP